MEIDRDGAPNADLIVANAVTYGGTLVVNNLGQPLQAGDTFNLFDWTTRSGSFVATELPTLDTGLTWNLSKLTVDGTIQVVTGGGVATNPTNLAFTVTGNTLDISWPVDHIGWTLQTQTNGLNIGISTNWVGLPESTATNRVITTLNPANGTVFYRLFYTIP
jgi:hypothetical protein